MDRTATRQSRVVRVDWTADYRRRCTYSEYSCQLRGPDAELSRAVLCAVADRSNNDLWQRTGRDAAIHHHVVRVRPKPKEQAKTTASPLQME